MSQGEAGTVGVGIVGLGFMGMIHYHAYGRVPGAKVVALSSRDPAKRAGDWTGIRGNFGPRGGRMDLSGVSTYADLEGLLADPAVGLVDLCVPNDEHAGLAIRALEAGKDVLVEKPIALSLDEADRMIDAARASGRRLMVAHVLPYVPEFAHALGAVRSGRYGALQAAHLMRVISKPDWSSGIGDASRSGGPAVDLHIHDTHFLLLLCGMPDAVSSRGVVRDGAVVHLSTQYSYGRAHPMPVVTSVCGALGQPGRPFAHGFQIYLEGATLVFEFDNDREGGHLANPLTVFGSDGSVERPVSGSGDPVDAFVLELADAVRAAESGEVPPGLSAAMARDALALALAEMDGARAGRPVALV